MVQKHTSLCKEVPDTGTELMSVENLPHLQKSNDDAETYKRVHSFPIHFHSMSDEHEVQLWRDVASFEMTSILKKNRMAFVISTISSCGSAQNLCKHQMIGKKMTLL